MLVTQDGNSVFLSFFLVLVATLSQGSCYISRYHMHVQEKKECMAKDKGQHPYHKSENIPETLLILKLPYCVTWILPSCKRGCWNKYSNFAFGHCCPKQNWSSINKKESRIDIGKMVSYLPFVHLMMISWNPSPPSWTIIRQFSPWLLLVCSWSLPIVSIGTYDLMVLLEESCGWDMLVLKNEKI